MAWAIWQDGAGPIVHPPRRRSLYSSDLSRDRSEPVTYIKAFVVGVLVAVVFAVVWGVVAIAVPIWWQMWQQRGEGGGAAGSAVGTGSILLAALIGFVLGSTWIIWRAGIVRRRA